jgi:hypothetical protein
VRLFDADDRYRWRLARTLTDHAHANDWFFDAAGEGLGLRRGLEQLTRPARFAAAHRAVVAALDAAEAEERRREPEFTSMVEHTLDAYEALDALAAQAAGAGSDEERAYARALAALRERAAAEAAAALERSERAGAKALEKLRRLRPPAARAEEHERIVAAFADLVAGQGATRRAVLARDRPEAQRRWAAAEPRRRELHAALDRLYAPGATRPGGPPREPSPGGP